MTTADSSAEPRPTPRLRQQARGLLEHTFTQHFITAVIIINAVVIGAETSPALMADYGGLLTTIDGIALSIFVTEITLKLWVYRGAFFRNGWNWFDTIVIGISLVPTSEGASVLRALRIIRAMRLISVVPSMRIVTQALLRAVPGMGAVVSLLLLIFYIAAVMATKLFGHSFPEWFGNLGASAYSLFQIMTLESWSMGIVRPVMAVHPYAWAFFVPFILIVTFAVLNLFIAIIVNAMHEATPQTEGPDSPASTAAIASLHQEIRELRRDLADARSHRNHSPPN